MLASDDDGDDSPPLAREPTAPPPDPAAQGAPPTAPSAAPKQHKPHGFVQTVSLDMIPAVRIGAFCLGAGLRDVMGHATSARNAAAYGEIEVVCDERDPVGRDVLVRLPKAKLTLTFDSVHHKLRRITLDSLVGVELWIHGRLLCGPNATPTFVRLYDLLGPTFGSAIDPDTGRYVLRYPGLEVVFVIPPDHRGTAAAQGEHPVLLPDGTTPVAQHLAVVDSSIASEQSDATPAPPAAVVLWNEGVRLPISRDGLFTHQYSALRLGMSEQDVVSVLGPPADVFVKDDERLLIHAPRNGLAADFTRPRRRHHAPGESLLSFLNYPNFGLDLGFSTCTHLLEKIVLFNAVPPHEAFLRYHRCHFRLALTSSAAIRLLAAGRHVEPVVDAASIATVELKNDTRWSTFVSQLRSAFVGRPDLAAVLPEPLLATPTEGVLLRLFALNGLHACVVASTDVVASITLVRATSAALVASPRGPRLAVPSRGAVRELPKGGTMPPSPAQPAVTVSTEPVVEDVAPDAAWSSPEDQAGGGSTDQSLGAAPFDSPPTFGAPRQPVTDNSQDADTVADDEGRQGDEGADCSASHNPHAPHHGSSVTVPPSDANYESDFHSATEESCASRSPLPTAEEFAALSKILPRHGLLPPLANISPKLQATAAAAANAGGLPNEDSADSLFPPLGAAEAPQQSGGPTLADLLLGSHSQGSSNGSKKKGKKGKR